MTLSKLNDQETELYKITNILEAAFNQIYRERMIDIPVINDKIGVHAIAFQPWNQSYLGIMITPWFMNLMLLPGPSENWDARQELTTSTHIFPSGKYKFLMGFEPQIGKYQTCSLFSPMFEFSDNNTAIETAEVVLKELMNSENIEQGDIQSEQIEKIWSGEEQKTDEVAEPPEKESQVTLKEKINQPMSRRKLLRGALLIEDEKNE